MGLFRMTDKRIFIVLAIAVIAGVGRPARSADVIVVCPVDFQVAVQPWLEHRRGEGLQVRVIESARDAQSLRASICDASGDDTRYVVLIGDAPVIGTPCDARCQTPILYAPTKVTSAWGSTPTLSSDLLFGDFDRDDVPDAVVGRLPVDEPAQLEALIARIIAREKCDDFGPWRSQIQFVGGVGGFGAMADGAIESVARTVITNVLPPETKTSIAYASPGHSFFPTDRSFTDAVINRYQQGARFWVYAGHGQVTELDRVPRNQDGTPVLDQRSVKRLSRSADGSSIAIILACYTGALDAPEDSIAEEMVLNAGGPIAVFAGSRVTMPYGNTTAAIGLIDGVFSQKLARLGDAWRYALDAMHCESPPDTSSARVMIDALATIVSPAGTNLVEERREHMLLYNLIGDPTLRLNHPQSLVLQVPTGHAPGEPVEVQVESPIDGELKVSFDRPLGAVVEGDPNETTIASFTTRVEAGQMVSRQVTIPAGVTGPIMIRAFVKGASAWATSAARTIVR
jgi:hypothetical protein